MTKSVNQSWAVSNKFRAKYGDIWANMDFIFNERISSNNFKIDPMNTAIGHLSLANRNVLLRYKDLIAYAKDVSKSVNKSHKAPLTELFPIEIKNNTFMLNRIEIARLRETLDDTLLTTQRSYELGLYL
jgi:hypothetical protein|tara:strand:+ start:878 stop:1264 length:387 start_codon:yes stop_codon:yes gene_type:complete